MALSYTQIQAAAETLLRLEADAAPGHLEAAVREIPERLRRGRLTLAVLGQFKRGKSTLVNALLGAPVMPSSVLPLTSVVTFVRYGEKPQITVRYQDGREEARPPEELAAFVTEEKNPRNERGVSWVRVEWPSPFLKRPLRMVDTPGVGSVYNHNTATSEAFLGHMDAAIFVLGVDPVLTETEIDWLRRVKDRAERFFFVLNKTDQLRPEEVEKVLAFTQAQLRAVWGREGRIYPLSARRALENPEDPPFRLFREDLEAFLDREGSRVLLASLERKLRRGIRSLLMALALEREAARRPADEMAKRLQELREEEERLELEKSRGLWVLNEAGARFLKKLKERMESRWEEVRGDAEAAVRRAYDDAPTVGKARLLLVEALEGFLEGLFAGFREEAEREGQEEFERAVAYLAREEQATADRLVKTAGEWFHLELPGVEVEVPPPAKSRFYVLVPPELAGLSTAGGSPVNLLPARWGRPLALKPFLKKTDLFFAMQRDQLLSDLAGRFDARAATVVTAFSDTLREILKRLQECLARGMALKQKSEAEREEALRVTGERERQLQALLKGLGPEPPEAGEA